MAVDEQAAVILGSAKLLRLLPLGQDAIETGYFFWGAQVWIPGCKGGLGTFSGVGCTESRVFKV